MIILYSWKNVSIKMPTNILRCIFLDSKSRQERLENPDIKCFGTDRTLKQNQNVTFDGTVSAYNASGVDINNKKERKEIQTGLT